MFPTTQDLINFARLTIPYQLTQEQRKQFDLDYSEKVIQQSTTLLDTTELSEKIEKPTTNQQTSDNIQIEKEKEGIKYKTKDRLDEANNQKEPASENIDQAVPAIKDEQLVIQKNQQKEVLDNKKWTKNLDKGIILTIATEPCQISEFINQSYTYSISTSIPISRLKQKSDAWQVSGDTATTVLGCWSKNNGLIHAKLRRKKDGKTWEQDFKLDDGSWISE
jgi:hypothetical protein